MGKPLRVIEAAYAPAASDAAWLESVGAIISDSLGAPAGVVAGFIDWTVDGVDTHGWARAAGASEAVLEFTKAKHDQSRLDSQTLKEVTRLYSRGSLLCGTREWIPELFARLEELQGTSQEETGNADSLNLVCMDASHRGAVFVHPFPELIRTEPNSRALWSQIAAHVTAGLRMHRSCLSRHAIDSGDAILGASFEVLHANETTQDSIAPLRQAARDIDKARLRGTSEDEALALWQCLFSGEYSVIDRFDTDGKRLFVAKKNAPMARGPRTLTERERQVVALVSVGHSDKSAAYELGIAEGTVANHLHTALKKLGIASASDLGLLRAALGEP